VRVWNALARHAKGHHKQPSYVVGVVAIALTALGHDVFGKHPDWLPGTVRPSKRLAGQRATQHSAWRRCAALMMILMRLVVVVVLLVVVGAAAALLQLVRRRVGVAVVVAALAGLVA